MIAIPCNAAHHFVPRLQVEINIPVLNMIEETCRVLRTQAPGASAAGLMAATGTVRSRIYHSVLGRHGVCILTPRDVDQDQVQSAILRIKAGERDPAIRDFFEDIANRLLRAGAEVVILGCTEIPLAFDPARVGYPVLNPTRILAQVAVDWALGRSN